MSSVNVRLLNIQVSKQIKGVIDDKIESIVSKKIDAIRQSTIEELDANPITQEIEAGPNQAGSLPNGGNLFSFLGFYKGENPINSLRSFLRKNIKVKKGVRVSVKNKKIIVTSTIETPTLESAYENAYKSNPLDWTSKSWLHLIESGIPNFSKFLFGKFNSPPSRSTSGIQSEYDTGNGPSPLSGGTRYISEILKNLRNKISNTKK